MPNQLKFLDYVGTSYLWSKIKDQLDLKATSADVAALQALHAINKTVAEEVSDGIAALNLANTYAAKSIENTVSTLVGSDTSKSVRTIANEELATQLIAENAQASLDSLQEIAAWIQSHPGDASAINSAISALQAKSELGTYDDNGEDVEYATVKDYVEAYVHQFANEAVLDGITATQVTNWDDANTKKHTHGNQDVLDTITQEQVNSWNVMSGSDTYVAITNEEIDAIIAGTNEEPVYLTDENGNTLEGENGPIIPDTVVLNAN